MAAASSKPGLLWITTTDVPIMTNLLTQMSERYDVTLEVARCAEEFFETLNTAEEYPSGVVICTHGTSHSFLLGDHKVVTSTDVSKKCEFIKGRGISVVLMSCNTGKGANPIAARVAELGFKVLAPTVDLCSDHSTLHPDPRAEYPVYFPDSRIFSSDGSASEYQFLSNDHYDALKRQMRDGHSDSIAIHDVESFLLKASMQGDTEALKLPASSTCLSRISSFSSGKLLLYAQKNNHAVFCEALLESSDVGKIPSYDLEKVCRDAAKTGHAAIIKSLIRSNHFYEISEKNIEIAFYNAFKNGHGNIVKSFIKSRRYGEIHKLLERTISCAIKSGDYEQLQRHIHEIAAMRGDEATCAHV